MAIIPIYKSSYPEFTVKSKYRDSDGNGIISFNNLVGGSSSSGLSGYAWLAGRSGGQILIGGSNASENLVFQSTSNATRGYIGFNDNARLIYSSTKYVDLITNSSGDLNITPVGICRINSNFGIGKNPSCALDVVGMEKINATLDDTNYASIMTNPTLPNISVGAPHYFINIYAEMTKCPISVSVTDSGYRIGIDAGVYIADTNFKGTLNQQTSVWARSGTYGNGGSINPTGTIINSYGVYVDCMKYANTTITNQWGIYQCDTNSTGLTKNYFDGSMEIKGTIKLQNLAGVGTRNVVVDANGNLSAP